MAIGSTSRRQRGLMRKVVLLVFGFSLLWSSAASADLFLSFSYVDGGSTEIHHRGWSDISNVSWGVSNATVWGSSGYVLDSVFSDLSWHQVMDQSFPILFEWIAPPRRIDTATIDFTGGSNNETYFQMVFEGVHLTHLDVTGTSGGILTFAGAFAYDEIAMTYTIFDTAGQIVREINASYNLRRDEGSVGGLGLLFGMGLAGPMTVEVVPLPPTALLLGSGLLGLVGWRRFRKS
jgi:type VI protein secretion system component Hcp